MPTSLIISDLHLDDGIPERTQALVDLLDHFRCQISAFYILGDLFNYWIGDDYQPKCAKAVAECTRTLPWVGWIFGNRDFLLGTDNYFTQSAMHPLEEVHKCTLAGKTAILCHGDHLCTDDGEHQRNRKMYTTTPFQQQLLAKSIQERLAIANQSSNISSERKQQLSEEIMDVNPDAVESILQHYQADVLIHGHTHRPDLHNHKNGLRMVLGEWTDRGWYIIENQGVLKLVSFPIPFSASDTHILATIGEHRNT